MITKTGLSRPTTCREREKKEIELVNKFISRRRWRTRASCVDAGALHAVQAGGIVREADEWDASSAHELAHGLSETAQVTGIRVVGIWIGGERKWLCKAELCPTGERKGTMGCIGREVEGGLGGGGIAG